LSARVLSDVDLAVDNSEVVLVAGHSGPGKTILQYFGNLVDRVCGLEGGRVSPRRLFASGFPGY
jgi:ABC-type polar amino acid transport system ATPase subunit